MEMTGCAEHSEFASGGDGIALAQSALQEGSGGKLAPSNTLQPLLRTILAGGTAFIMSGPTAFASSPSQYGSSAVIRDLRSREVRRKATETAPSTPRVVDFAKLTVTDQLLELLASLSLNKSQMASVLGVSRPTLYEWLNGNEPKKINTDRIDSLHRVLAAAGVSSTKPLNARFVQRRMVEDQPNLLEALKNINSTEDELNILIKAVQNAGVEAGNRRVEREERLRDLGYDDPNTEQRQNNTKLNVALLDWQKH